MGGCCRETMAVFFYLSVLCQLFSFLYLLFLGVPAEAVGLCGTRYQGTNSRAISPTIPNAHSGAAGLLLGRFCEQNRMFRVTVLVGWLSRLCLMCHSVSLG